MNLKSDSPITLKMKSLYPDLKPSEKRVADYILLNTESFIYSNLSSASKAAGVSEATFVRFAKVLGYEGYRDLHIAVAASQQKDTEEGVTDLSVDENTCFTEIPERVINLSVHALNSMRETLNGDEYAKAVDVLEKAGRICVFGSGSSAFVGEDFTNKFLRLGKFVQLASDPHIQVTYAVSMNKGDVAVGISHSGKTQQTIEALRLAKAQGATILCITNFEASMVANMADIKLLTASHEKIFESETMVSRLSQLAIIDMLYLGMIRKNYEYYAPIIEKQNTTIVPMFFSQSSRNGGEGN